ncbi:hypothetical protein JCGZ_22984 [Jatropha curcas]|uniref:Uncharacterized protein n=1 Tax=Jatropha curcas TaxID=180498 RepID=A0A067JSX4_JATCU|nr:hypothetical protein JCGZ_22984 [Jatropha curcas]
MLHDQSGDEHIGDMDSGVGEARAMKENVRITDVPFDIDEGELLDACFTYNLLQEYKLIQPSEGMSVIEPLDRDSIIDAKNNCNIFSNKSKIFSLKNWKSKYFMVKYPGGFGVPNHWFEDLLCHLSASPTSYEQTCVELIKARGVGSVNLMSSGKEACSIVLDTQPTEVDTAVGVTHSELPPSSLTVKPLKKRQREVLVPGLPHVPLRALDIRNKGDEDEKGEEDVNRPVDDSSPPRVETEVSTNIHPVSSEGRGAAGDGSTD